MPLRMVRVSGRIPIQTHDRFLERVLRAHRPLLFKPDAEPRFGRDFCFLCGAKLTAARDSDEHVIPKWVQERYDLWDQKLTLLNRTQIPYRQLKIPCCKTCNSEHLGKIEAGVQRACDSGRDAVSTLPPLTLFLWVGKIFFGLLYREHLLDWDRRDDKEGPIVPAEVLDHFRLHHQFLQAARIPMEFVPCVPASLFVFNTLEPTDAKARFDYWDFPFALGLSIRVGKVGIVACLQDGGAVAHSFAAVYRKYDDLSLHWAQFAELTARVFYDLSRFNRAPKFMLIEGDARVQVVLNPLGGLSGKPLFDAGNLKDYAKVLAHCMRVPLEQVYRQPDLVMSWLNENGKVRRMAADDPA